MTETQRPRPVVDASARLRLAAPRLLLAISLLVAAGGSPPAGLARGRDGPRTLERWHEGPVRYLMTRSETRLFRRLESREERLAFIRRFWDRRDPNPTTPLNERRVTFWRRVAEANRQFNDTARPGWRTDRGKIYILLGPPSDIEERGEYDTGIRSASRGLLRWHYDGLRQAASRTGTIIAFIREGDYDWRLTADPKLSSVYLDINRGANEAYTETSPIDRLASVVPWGGGTLGTAMDLGRLQQVPSERELLRTVVTTEQFVGSYDGLVTATPMGGAGEGELVAITLALRKDQLLPPWDGTAAGLAQRFSASVQLEPAGDSADSFEYIDIDEGAFVAEPVPDDSDPYIRFQAIRPVPPGSWLVAGAVYDRSGGGIATCYSTIDVAELSSTAPRFAGPMLARRIVASGGPARDLVEPYRVGKNILIPRMSDVIRTDERFTLYVQVYPAPTDPGPVRLSWTFLRADTAEGPFKELRETASMDDASGPRAWDLEPGRLSPGFYRVVFKARSPRGTELARWIHFSVVEPSRREDLAGDQEGLDLSQTRDPARRP